MHSGCGSGHTTPQRVSTRSKGEARTSSSDRESESEPPTRSYTLSSAYEAFAIGFETNSSRQFSASFLATAFSQSWILGRFQCTYIRQVGSSSSLLLPIAASHSLELHARLVPRELEVNLCEQRHLPATHSASAPFNFPSVATPTDMTHLALVRVPRVFQRCLQLLQPATQPIASPHSSVTQATQTARQTGAVGQCPTFFVGRPTHVHPRRPRRPERVPSRPESGVCGLRVSGVGDAGEGSMVPWGPPTRRQRTRERHSPSARSAIA